MQNTDISVRNTALIMVMLNAFTTPLMLSATNVALPNIAIDLKLDAITLSWVPMAYLMASAMFVLIFGRLADQFGRKRIFLLGTFCVIVTSILAACSINGLMLVSTRFLQGVCAAMLYATQIAIVSSVFPPKERGRVIGLTISTIYLGLTGGPLIGGYFVDELGWRWSFIFYIPLALIVLLIGLFKVPGDWSSDRNESIDYVGSLIYIISIGLVCIGVSLLPESTGMMLLTAGISGIILFINYSVKSTHPIFDVSLYFKNRVFAFSSLASFIIYASTYANVVLISLYLQFLKHMSATEAGFIMMTQPLTMAILSPVAGKLSDKIEPRIIASLGMTITGIGLLTLANLERDSSLGIMIFALVITGVGFSLFSSPNVNAIMSAIEPRYYGSVTASLATMRILGQMGSMVIVTMVFALIIGSVQIRPENYLQLEKSIQICFSMAAIFCLPGLVFSLIRGRIHS